MYFILQRKWSYEIDIARGVQNVYKCMNLECYEQNHESIRKNYTHMHEMVQKN